MDRAIFLDRDNTIIANDADLGDPEAVELLPGAADAIAALQGMNYVMVVVTNQGGVARGKFTPADVDAVHQRLADLLYQEAEATIERYYYCPFHPKGTVEAWRREHPWRKPQPGMLLQAAADLKLNLHESWMVGDHVRDIQAGKAAGVRTILLTDLSKGELPPEDRPDFVAANLLMAANIITDEPKKPSGKPIPLSLPPSIKLPDNRTRHNPQAVTAKRVEGTAALAMPPHKQPPATAAHHKPGMMSASLDDPQVLARIGMTDDPPMPEDQSGLTLDTVALETQTPPSVPTTEPQLATELPDAQALMLEMTRSGTCMSIDASQARLPHVQLMLFPEISFMTHPPQTNPSETSTEPNGDELTTNEPLQAPSTPSASSAATNPPHVHVATNNPGPSSQSKTPSFSMPYPTQNNASPAKPGCGRPAPVGMMGLAAGVLQIAVISLALLALLTVGNPTKFFQCIGGGILLQLMAGAFWMLDRNCCR